MGNENLCDISALVDGFLNGVLRLHVQRRCGVVQNENLAVVFRQSARDGDPLFLTAGKADAPLSDDRLVALRKPLGKE